MQASRSATRHDVGASPSPVSSLAVSDWDLPRRPSTVREVIEGLDPLLEAVRLQLGPNADRRALVDQLHHTLSFDRRESSLPIAHISDDDPPRFDLAVQAREISSFIIETVRAVNENGVSIDRHGESTLSDLLLRSRCDGHLWHPSVNMQLTGPDGGPHVMQLYNEWLHQIVLLRDILLPFANWQSLPIPLQRFGAERGLRALEEPRGRFIGKMLFKQVEHVMILRLAQAVFGVEPKDNTYGFSVDGVTVLPASVEADVCTANKALLTWHEGTLDGIDGAAAVRFFYRSDDYFAQPRSEIADGSAPSRPLAAAGRLQGRMVRDGAAVVDIVVTLGEAEYRVDLGQALRNHRFSYRPGVDRHAACVNGPQVSEAIHHGLPELFSLPAMATASRGIHVVPRAGDRLVDLAVLGKIYPENTVIRGDATWEQVLRAGKQYGARFIVQ